MKYSLNLNYEKDKDITKFGLETLRRDNRYMLPEETSPQEAYGRAASAFASNQEHAQRMYEYVSNRWFMFSTPILSNGGTSRGLPISCFLNDVDDSREGLSNHYTENIWLSTMGGGVGSNWSRIRSQGESTTTGNKTTGLIPFMHVVDSIMLAASQGATRRGSCATYLDISHPEIEEFLIMRKASGGDINRKNLNLHHGVNIPNSFMECVENDSEWSLVDPNSQAVVKKIKARELWVKLLETRVQTGEPYFHFIDTSNKTLPTPLKDLGLRIRTSNLCVAPETKILTTEGHKRIDSLEDTFVEVWNGEEFSEVVIKKTGENQELITVTFSDGSSLDCTPYHKFYIQEGYNKKAITEVQASQLQTGDKLEKWDLPTEKEQPKLYQVREHYSQGFYQGDGNKDLRHSWLYEPKYICEEFLVGTFSNVHNTSDRKTWYHGVMKPKGYVPTDYSFLPWLAGYLDADGTVVKSDNGDTLQLGSIDLDVLNKVRMELITYGVHSKVTLMAEERVTSLPDGRGGEKDYLCQPAYRLLIATAGVRTLLLKGLYCHRLKFNELQEPQRDARRFITVVSVENKGRLSDTYCFTEPKRHRGMFNGIVTGQCNEIFLPTAPDRTAVCCLSSVNLEKFEEWRDDANFIPDCMEFLDNVLQSFIDTAPSEQMKRAIYSATRERSVGLGAMGFHSFLQSKGVPFESAMAVSWNRKMFAHLHYATGSASLDLGRARGEAPDMQGTGHRFSHRMAVAPNASSGVICGASPSIEPWNNNAFRQDTLSGSFLVKNKHLDKLLEEEYGMNTDEVWSSIITNEGSVQHLVWMQDYHKDIFKTAFELDQRWIIQHAADRQEYICQGQSTNLFFKSDANVQDVHDAHFLAWKKELKGLYYCRSKSAKQAEVVSDKVERGNREDFQSPSNDDECLACQG